MLIVQKYGGSSLAGRERMLNAARRVAEALEQGHRVVVVVSAQGDTTDELIAKAIHPDSLREMDAYMATGEQQSAALMAMALHALGREAVSLTGWQAGIRTDGAFGDARIQSICTRRILRELEQGRAVVVAGFQGLSEAGDVTTLGRGGSDTTAVALAGYLQADRCQIYTDVDGVYDKDPRKHPDAVRYDTIDYDTMLALARSGAQVLHDRCVELAKEMGVKVEVLSTFRPGPGTLVEGL